MNIHGFTNDLRDILSYEKMLTDIFGLILRNFESASSSSIIKCIFKQARCILITHQRFIELGRIRMSKFSHKIRSLVKCPRIRAQRHTMNNNVKNNNIITSTLFYWELKKKQCMQQPTRTFLWKLKIAIVSICHLCGIKVR